MPTTQMLGRSVMAGFSIAITFAVINGLSTYVLSGETLDQWVTSKVGA